MSETLQILEKLNTFYSGAFTQLITYTVGILAFIGIVIPFAIATFQNKQLKKDQTSLSNQIANELIAAKEEMKREIEEQMSKREEGLRKLVLETKNEIDSEIRKFDRLAFARSVHLQARSLLVDYPASAAFDALNAAKHYATYKDEQNLISSLALFKEAIPKVCKTDFDDYDIKKACDDAVKSIEKLNEHGRYTQELKFIKQSVVEAEKRPSE